MNTNDCSEKPDSTVQSVVALALATYGVKRGIARAAELLGVSERWVKSLRFGEPARVSADAYLRALQARQTLAAERAAQLRAELASLDQIAGIRPNDDSPSVLAIIARRPADDVARGARDCGGGVAYRAG